MTVNGEAMAAARSALGRGQWELARDEFAAVIACDEDAAAREGQAFAARMLGQHDASFAAYERAYRLYRDADDVAGAARVATWLGYNHETLRGDFAVASGWYARAHRLIDGRPLSLEHAWLAIREASRLLSGGLDPDRGRELAQLATAAAAAVGDVEVETVGRSLEGLAMVAAGDVDAGLRLLDESATALIAGDLDTVLPASLACCSGCGSRARTPGPAWRAHSSGSAGRVRRRSSRAVRRPSSLRCAEALRPAC